MTPTTNQGAVTGPHYISGAEAARLLDVDRLTVRRYIERGILEGHRTAGGQLRVRKTSASALKREIDSLAGLLTPQQAADDLGVALSTVQRWVREEKLPVRSSPGGRTFIRPEDVEALKKGR